MLSRLVLACCLLLTGCLLPHRRQQRMEREWQSIWQQWQIENKDDCDYINSFKKSDCLERRNLQL